MEKFHDHFRYFKIAGITVIVESDLDLDTIQFKPELASFAVDSPGDDQVTLRHYFELPNLKGFDLGEELYHKPPWIISHQAERDMWCYRTIPHDGQYQWHRVAMFNADYTYGTICSPPSKAESIRANGWESLSLFTTDQIWLVPVLADRHAVLLHSAAAIVNGRGLLFVGHSDSGKSTTMELLRASARGPMGFQKTLGSVEILCDDRNVIRKWDADPKGLAPPSGLGAWRVHGTWSHGTTADVSAASAPLGAILFFQQDTRNEILPLTDRKEIWKRLLATFIKSMVTAEWWQKEIDVLEQIVIEVPCYTMHFDKSGAIVDCLVQL